MFEHESLEIKTIKKERQLKKEIRRRVKAENQNQKHKDDIRLIQGNIFQLQLNLFFYSEKLTEKEKQLNYTNIYIQRQNKGKRQNRYF